MYLPSTQLVPGVAWPTYEEPKRVRPKAGESKFVRGPYKIKGTNTSWADRILDYLNDHPGATVSALSRDLNCPYSNVASTLMRMMKQGLIRRVEQPICNGIVYLYWSE